MKQNKTNTNDNIPALAKFYLGLYNAVPRVYLPGTNLDVGFMACWMALFFTMRAVMIPIFFSYGWPKDSRDTLDAVASLAGGFFHAPNIVPMAWVLTRSQKPFNPAGASKEYPRWWQDAVDAMLQLCTGYMVYDFCVLVWTRWVPGEGLDLDAGTILFMAHHFVTAFYMTTARFYGAGQCSALVCIFLGEFTNTPFNVQFVLEMARKLGLAFTPFFAQLETPNEIVTAALYLPCRIIFAPVMCSYMTYTLLVDKSARKCVPIFIRFLWIGMMFGVIHGSINQNIVFYNMLKGHMGFGTTGTTEPEL
jgi:hypothetical protein